MTLPVAPASAARGERRQVRRRRLLDVATATLLDGGPEAITMEGVAARAGVSKPIVYRHFANRTALLLAIYEDYQSHVAAMVSDALAEAGPGLDDLVRAAIRGYFDAVESKGFLVRVLSQAVPGEPDVLAASQRVRAGWIAFWTARVRAVGDVPPDVAHDAVAMVTQMAEQAAALWVSGQSPRARVEALYVQMALAALQVVVEP